jgi:hypothetical protein
MKCYFLYSIVIKKLKKHLWTEFSPFLQLMAMDLYAVMGKVLITFKNVERCCILNANDFV